MMEISGQRLATRTFHHSRFADVADLVRRKTALGLSVSLCIPTLNESRTIGPLVARLRCDLLDRAPLLDEIAVIDSGSDDGTTEQAATAGADVYRAAAILPEMGEYCGKGENLWKALYQLKGDILVFLDGDITNIHPGFVTGLVGPLLHNPHLGYAKAFYDRPYCELGIDGGLGGGRVTEILIRPLFSLYFPELTAFVQPLAGEYAVRRTLLEQLSFPVGYGVEAAHLIDVAALHGLDLFSQTDMGVRCHRNRSSRELGQMAFTILQVINRRLRQRGLVPASPHPAPPLYQFSRRYGKPHREACRIVEHERPPMLEVAAYRHKRSEIPREHGRFFPAAGGAIAPLAAVGI